MDKENLEWIGKEGNFYFRRKQEVVESLIVGKCLNIGCGEHKIKGAKNVDYPKFDVTNYNDWLNINKKYDTIILSDVIEHIKDENVWEKAVFHTKKRVIITVPAYSWLYSNYDNLLGHYRRYDNDSIFRHNNLNVKSSFLFGMLLPLFIIRKFTSGKTPKLPKWLDTIFYWLSKINLPWGSTMLVVIDKND